MGLFVVIAAMGIYGAAVAAPGPWDCRQATAPKFIDGRLVDWQEAPLALGKGNWRPEPGCTPIYGGDTDLSATVRMAWDAKYLYTAIAVVDDTFLPAKERPADTGDAILLRIGPSAPGTIPTAVEEFVVVGAANPAVYRRVHGTLEAETRVKVGYARTTLTQPKLLLRDQELPATATLNTLWFEMAIPWGALPAIVPAEHAAVGLEIQLLDDDGGGLRGRLKWRGLPGVPRTATDLGAVELIR